ncbi:uncharacterized protein LOC111034593, partial [Myzus persicae]|uniref:uncharacterized protein LOC111034593 n=1 Tax=Myzus persicae TaxID=13164 RepID=UPI000B934DEC
EDRRIDITEDNFRVSVFLPIIDTALSQLQGRFEGMKTVHNNFEFLTPSMILDSEESELIKTAYDFVQFYQNDISSDFPRQLLSLKENLKNMKLKTIRDLSDFFIENDLCSVYSDIMTACIIFLTLPVTVASAERSFSKLKLIKNYLRNSVSQERLSHIA